MPYSQDKSVYIWTEIAKSILLRCSDIEAILAVMVQNFRPSATSGEWSAKMEAQRPLLTKIQSFERAEISTAASRMLVKFDQSIK